MKSLKIVNIILFCLICAVEVVALFLMSSIFKALFTNDTAGLFATFLSFLPLFVIIALGIIVLTIILTITSSVLNKKLLNETLPPSKFARISVAVSWIICLVNVAMFIYLLINSVKSK